MFYYYSIGIKLVNIQLKAATCIIAVHVCHLCVIHRLIMHESIIKFPTKNTNTAVTLTKDNNTYY